ncbi:hypothetical protein ACXIUK_23510, partial [Vibrio parahaemolyticus]
GLVLAVGLAPTVAGADPGAPLGFAVTVEESGCYEFTEYQGTPVANLPTELTDGYRPELVPSNPTRTLLYVVDYVCADVRVGEAASAPAL